MPLCHNFAPELLPLPIPIILSEEQERIVWRWTAHDQYTAKSVYTKMMEGGMIKDANSIVRKYKVPQTVRIFAYLLL